MIESRSSDQLRGRLSPSDPGLRRLLHKQIHALETRHGDDFPEQVRSVLRTALLTGHAKANQVEDVSQFRTALPPCGKSKANGSSSHVLPAYSPESRFASRATRLVRARATP